MVLSTSGDSRAEQVVAEVEVGDEPVSQILGGEVVERCPGHGSCERSDVVSLIIDALHELRQCRPVALSEESLVELAGQAAHRCPASIEPLPSRLLTSLTPCAGIGGGPPRVDVPLLHMGEQDPPDRRQGRLRRELMVLLPWSQHAGGRAATTRAASSWA